MSSAGRVDSLRSLFFAAIHTPPHVYGERRERHPNDRPEYLSFGNVKKNCQIIQLYLLLFEMSEYDVFLIYHTNAFSVLRDKWDSLHCTNLRILLNMQMCGWARITTVNIRDQIL